MAKDSMTNTEDTQLVKRDDLIEFYSAIANDPQQSFINRRFFKDLAEAQL